jgi:hypothetical protein
MGKVIVERPAADEYAPHYAGYIAAAPGSDLLTAMDKATGDALEFLSAIPPAKHGFRYATGKWTVRDVLGHLIDTERVMAYRALRFARADAKALPGFEQDDYVKTADSEGREWLGLVEEFALLRHSNQWMFKTLPAEAWPRRGVASEREVSVRALGYIIVGHELWHRRVLREKYEIA